ncbi:hypothetical protein [Natronorubrum sp. FCH18a]|uniref:hypothetical protein n=1 Tax=Natronorubrum sp. FCH18a TaxID=3447018 RepID=UPI003F50FC98
MTRRRSAREIESSLDDLDAPTGDQVEDWRQFLRGNLSLEEYRDRWAGDGR